MAWYIWFTKRELYVAQQAYFHRFKNISLLFIIDCYSFNILSFFHLNYVQKVEFYNMVVTEMQLKTDKYFTWYMHEVESDTPGRDNRHPVSSMRRNKRVPTKKNVANMWITALTKKSRCLRTRHLRTHNASTIIKNMFSHQ